MTGDRIVRVLSELAHERGRGKTFCPSEAARRLDPGDWRRLMPEVRRAAAALGLRAIQRGRPVDPETARGPIRLSLPDE